MRFSRIVAIAATLFVLPAVAFASCTANVSVPAFSVAMKDLPVNYRFDLDSAALAKVADQNGMPGLKGEIPYGLTIGRYDLEVTVNTDSMRDGSGYCAQLRAAHVAIGLKQLDVIVDRRFASGSCQRKPSSIMAEACRGVPRGGAVLFAGLERALGKTSLPLNLHVADRSAARAAYLGPITTRRSRFSMRSTAARATETRVSICHTVTPQYQALQSLVSTRWSDCRRL